MQKNSLISVLVSFFIINFAYCSYADVSQYVAGNSYGVFQVKTEKDIYFNSEDISTFSKFENIGEALQDAELNLRIITGEETWKNKTWKTQQDFQGAVRSGVDTYGVNDWLVGYDDFEATNLNPNLWTKTGNVTILAGKLSVDASTETAEVNSNFDLEGDFDVQVEFFENNSKDNGVSFGISGDGFSFELKNTIASGYGCDFRVNGMPVSWNSTGSYSPSGKFRITRISDTISGYYWSANTWIEIKKGQFPELKNPGHIYLRIWRGPGYLGPNTTKFDNFNVVSGQIKTVNQTVGSVRLLPLNDNFDDGVLNLDRWETSGISENVEFPGALHMIGNTDSPVPGLVTKVPLAGDFSAVSFYKNYSSTPSGIRQGRYVMAADVSGSGYYIQRTSYDLSKAGGEYLASLSHINNQNWEMTSAVSFDSSFGKFRLRREGNFGLTDYWNGEKWVNQHSRPEIPTSPAAIRLYVYSQVDMPTVQAEIDSYFVENRIYSGSGKINFKHDSGGQGTQWGKIHFTRTQPAGTLIKFRTRTADTEIDLETAPWSEYISINGEILTSPVGRWIEIEATLATNNLNVTPLLHEMTVSYEPNPGIVLWEKNIPIVLAAGAERTFEYAVDPLDVIGELVLHGTLNSNSGQTLAISESPFSLEEGATVVFLSTDKKFYRAGEEVTVSGDVKNLSSIAAEGLDVRVIDPGRGGEELFSENFDLPPGSSYGFNFTITAPEDRINALTASVTQNQTILAERSEQFETVSPALSAVLVTPETVGIAPAPITVTLINSGMVEGVTHVKVATEGGTLIGEDDVAVPAGETRLIQFSHQISGDTTISAIISGDLEQTLSKMVSYIPQASDTTVFGSIVTDNVSYLPQEDVALTATISSGTLKEAVSAQVTVTNLQGAVLFSDTQFIPTIRQGETITLTNYWNVGTQPAGTYLVSLKVSDSTGNVVTRASCDLVVSSIAQAEALLQGTLALAQQSVFSGDPVNLTFGVKNIGNLDLSAVSLSIVTVQANDHTVQRMVTKQASLPVGVSFADSAVIDTGNFSARDYLVVLLATIGGQEKTLAGTYFRVEGAPSVPALIEPAEGTDVITPTPVLQVSNAADPNDDDLFYEFEVYADNSLTYPVVGGTVGQMASTTLWEVPLDLIENHTYYWRARGFDGLLYGPWMEVASFRVNVANDPPPAPRISIPANGTSVAELSPVLVVSNISDPDSSDVIYDFEVSNDLNFSQILTTGKGISAGPGTTAWPLDVTLEENGWYYWRARGDDLLDAGPWSEVAVFLVNSANDPPSAPTIKSPGSDSVVTSLSPEIIAANSFDPDSSVLTYYFEADVDESFSSSEIILSGPVKEEQGIILWPLENLLDNTWYYLRAKASDGMAESSWSEIVRVFANTTNDPPSTPVLDNPSNGAGVNQFTPTLSVRNAVDLDGDTLTYDFEVYGDAELTQLVAWQENVPAGPQITGWGIPWALVENEVYFWRARASDGDQQSDWMTAASFMVNTANDAPSAPQLMAPVNGGQIETLNPTLEILNALDPDNDSLTYDFELYSDQVLVQRYNDILQSLTGVTSVFLNNALADDTTYSWRVRAFDGERFGPWTPMGSFSTHNQTKTTKVQIHFDPRILNKGDRGRWVTVKIKLPPGYRASDVDLSSIRLEHNVPIESWSLCGGHWKHRNELTIKFPQREVANVLPEGRHVPVRVSGTIGACTFEGVDVIRVMGHQRRKNAWDDHRGESRNDAWKGEPSKSVKKLK